MDDIRYYDHHHCRCGSTTSYYCTKPVYLVPELLSSPGSYRRDGRIEHLAFLGSGWIFIAWHRWRHPHCLGDLDRSDYVYRKREITTFWEGCMIVLLAFFVFYPKINLCYYLLPISLLIVWGVDNRPVTIRCFALYIPLIIAACLTENVTGQPAKFSRSLGLSDRYWS